jgi:hypothetical protein
MDVFAVFRQGKWIEYTPSVTATASADPRWTDVQKHLAASVYVSLLSKGVQTTRAQQLSEAYVFKSLYPGLKYDKQTEQALLIARE